MLQCFASLSVSVTLVALICSSNSVDGGSLKSASDRYELNKGDESYLNGISTEEWQQCLEFGIDVINKQKRLEDNLLHSQITVENGSISHTLLLDALPSNKAKEDNEIAKTILASSQYVYNSKCLPRGISGLSCEAFLQSKQLPLNSELMRKCADIIKDRRNAHNIFRRLLPRHYKDGLYEMYSVDQLPSPLWISSKMHELSVHTNPLDDKERSLAVAQWAQFIEHDLSKPIVTSMSDGSSIECCNKDNYELQPRHRHPSCQPIIAKNERLKYGRNMCLNYVRSAVAVGSECTFGAIEQLNQATGYLDLSQLYGFTDRAQQSMRSFKNGHIKSSRGGENPYEDLLPTTSVHSHEYCAFSNAQNHSVCFMAGDSRVNSSPFTILIYTIFMRSHNQIADKLLSWHPDWNDEQLFQVAKAINVDIYRRIVFREWLPAVLGERIADSINAGTYAGSLSQAKDTANATPKISNEFAVAAIRFYLSMIPNALHNAAAVGTDKSKVHNAATTTATDGDALAETNVFVLSDQLYKPDLSYTAGKLNEILESLLNQSAMKMDASYEDSLILVNTDSVRPTHGDVFALDIQRGRDHGLQGYTKYVELCNNVKINGWKDLEKFMNSADINTLKSIYKNYDDIDLVVGAISEIPADGSIVGPTFTCILAEQFAQIHQWHKTDPLVLQQPEMNFYKSVNGVQLLCANSDLKSVPTDIFHIASKRNPLLPCEKNW